jgi:hypothetical protein
MSEDYLNDAVKYGISVEEVVTINEWLGDPICIIEQIKKTQWTHPGGIEYLKTHKTWYQYSDIGMGGMSEQEVAELTNDVHVPGLLVWLRINSDEDGVFRKIYRLVFPIINDEPKGWWTNESRNQNIVNYTLDMVFVMLTMIYPNSEYAMKFPEVGWNDIAVELKQAWDEGKLGMSIRPDEDIYASKGGKIECL